MADAIEMDDFISSDLEFSPRSVSGNPRAGHRSIEGMLSNIFEDRILLKKRSVLLQLKSGAPTTQTHLVLWRNRLEAYLKKNSIV